MVYRRRIRSMAEGGVLAAVAILFAFMSAYLPLIGSFVNLIWPVPLVLLGVRNGYKWSLLTTVVVGILIALLMHPLQAVSIVVGFGLIGIVLGHAIRNQYGPVKTLAVGSAASLLSKAAVMGILFLVSGINPLIDQSDIAAQALEKSIEVYQSFGLTGDQLAQMKEQMALMASMIKIILPAGLVMAAVLDTFLNYWVARLVLRRLGHVVPAFPAFSRWRLPTVFAYAFIAAIGLLYWATTHELQWLKDIALNLQVLSSVFLFLQGLSLVFYLTERYQIGKMVRTVAIFLIVTNGLLSQVVILAGAFDMVLDYRRLRKNGSTEQ